MVLQSGSIKRGQGPRENSGKATDHVGTEAGPVLVASYYHWYLAVAHFLDASVSGRVFRDIDDRVINALSVKRARGCGALDAGGLGIDGDSHRILTEVA
jgi:hypothetical protein